MSHIDLSPVTLLLQEVQTVTSAMRRNMRWSSSVPASTFASSGLPSQLSRNRRASTPMGMGRRRDDEGDLMGNFVALRRALTGVTGEPLPDRS